MYMGSDEQRAKWETMIRDIKMTGAYAQTEIGHGSNVSGLETTATFDKERDEFVIHTPTPSATKWWPGDLGLFSTHSIVHARLMIDGNFYGVFPFMVQIRDMDTYMPMKGVECGDMGPKIGYNMKNNGWATFNQVRIPRDSMLMKYVKVDRDGTFSLQGDIRALYSTMMSIRVQMLSLNAFTLGKCLNIAIRYSVVRR